MKPAGRFAPSPTGDLHAGSVLAALGSWLFARRAGGDWRVRIEDVDLGREVAGAAERQLAQLSALGLHADGDIVRQSTRGALYQAALDRLVARGDAFECHCSRSDIALQGGVHRQCVAHRQRPDPAWRLRVPDNTTVDWRDRVHGSQQERVDAVAGDFVLKRADGYWAYQLAVVVDDAAQQISEVVRGGDLLESTARQIYLQRCLGLSTPEYVHLPLLLDANGRKLSKSLGAEAVSAANARLVLCNAWQALGQSPLPDRSSVTPQRWLEDACQAFDPARIPMSPIAQ